MIRFVVILCTALTLACAPSTDQNAQKQKLRLDWKTDSLVNFTTFDRSDIKQRLSQKIKSEQTLIVHVFVPLCDNDNQGIVPVSKALGDGDNLITNLYWGHYTVLKPIFRVKRVGIRYMIKSTAIHFY